VLITNVGEGELETAAFPELYYKRWPIETKYNQVKQKFELEHFSGRLVDNIRQDFYAMMRVRNMLSSSLREANEKIPKGRTKKKRRYEYREPVFKYTHSVCKYRTFVLQYGKFVLEYEKSLCKYGTLVLQYGTPLCKYGRPALFPKRAVRLKNRGKPPKRS
jgi:hypothetical protein